jgi:polar amino acid transport system permease protein
LNIDLLRALFDTATVTVQVTGLAVAWGTVVAVVLGVVSLSPNPLVRAVVRVYVEVLRGVSAIILLLWCFFALPLFGIFLEPIQAGVLALGLNLSAYGAEIVRGAVQAVPKGQTEAAIAVNLSPLRRIWSVILPQSAITMIPPYGNLLIEVLKASSLVSLIGIHEIMYEANTLRRLREYPEQDIFTAVLIVYFVLSLGITVVVRLVERYFSRGLDIQRTELGGPVKMFKTLANGMSK